MIQLFRATLDTDAILRELKPVLESGWIGLGPKVAELERRLGETMGTNFVCLNSGTAALHLAVHALGLPRGSLVATTPITFVSTNMALLYEGLIPVFCDVEKTTGVMDVTSLERALSKYDIKAIMVVHLGGYLARMEVINGLGLPVIEDCAHALGSVYIGCGGTAGNNICCWSFHAVKALPLGDGGAISTLDPRLTERLRRLRWLGIDRSTSDRTQHEYLWEYNVTELGYKYHMNDITAAVGLAMLPRVDEQNRRRRGIAERYIREIKPAMMPTYRADRRSSYHFLPLFFRDREAVAKRLREAGIQYGMHYVGNHHYPMFKDCPRMPLKGATWYEKHELTLPIHPSLTDDEVSRVIEVVNSC